MEQKNKLLLFFLLIPPLVELITSSTPLLEFFNPLTALFIILYGVSNLIIRELKIRWNLQWSIIFLAIAFGIYEEGLLVQSFFNPHYPDVGVLSNFLTFHGLQIIWSLKLILLHSTISVLVPIYFSELIFPTLKNETLLSRSSWLFAIISELVLIFICFSAILSKSPPYQSYNMDVANIIITVLVIFFLIILSYFFRNSRISTDTKILSAKIFFLYGFLFQFLNTIMTDILAKITENTLITFGFQCLLIILTFIFAKYQICNKNATTKHIYFFVYGNLLFFILLVLFGEFIIKLSSLQYMFIPELITLFILEYIRKNLL